MKRNVVLLLFMICCASPAAALPSQSGALARTIGQCGDVCVVQANNGGRVLEFERAAHELRATGKRLVIDGFCASSCMTLAAQARPRACITERAVFAYHKTNFGRPIPLPGDLRAWIVRHGGFPAFSAGPGIMPNEVAQRYWPLCRNTVASRF